MFQWLWLYDNLTCTYSRSKNYWSTRSKIPSPQNTDKFFTSKLTTTKKLLKSREDERFGCKILKALSKSFAVVMHSPWLNPLYVDFWHALFVAVHVSRKLLPAAWVTQTLAAYFCYHRQCPLWLTNSSGSTLLTEARYVLYIYIYTYIYIYMCVYISIYDSTSIRNIKCSAYDQIFKCSRNRV